MGQLKERFIKSISVSSVLILCLFFAIVPGRVLAQTAGDIAFTGFNGDDNDAFAVVALNDIAGSAVIHFSSEEWDGSAFSGSGGHLDWTTPAGGVSAGTVVVFNTVRSTPSVSTGSIDNDSNINLSVSGDVIYAYTGPDQDTPDKPFLGAIATAADEYNQPDGTEGTLANTGLNQGTTAILLSDNIDVAQYIGDRSGNTKNGYLDLLNDVTSETATDDNWKQVNGTGDQSGQILPFDTQSFVLISPPTLHFTASADTVVENGGSIDLTVELAEATGEAVSVEVAFASGSSSADGSDINNYSTQTVNFTASDNSGATRTVTVTLTDDSNFEGNENAVFQLQNPSTGSVVAPETLTLTIIDDEVPAIVFNEINADPGDDANGDGTVDSDTDEFVEFVNNSGHDIDISGWTYADGNLSDARYTFPEGAVIGAGNAVLLFDDSGGAEPQGNFGAAYVYTDAEIGLNNSSETLSLFDADDNLVVSTTYPNEASGESNNLNPDGTGSSYADHSTLSPTGAKSSPGTKVDGTTWGNGTYAVAFRGSEGYRFVATPTQSTSFSDLFAPLWTQGIPGSDAPSASDANLFSWSEPSGGSFDVINSMGDQMKPGKGYIMYAFEDDDFRAPGIQGGFPKVIHTSEAENSSPVQVQVTATDNGSNGIDGDEGYNLLGNPYGTDISVDAVIAAVEAAVPSATVNQNVYIWNNATSSYEMLATGSGNTIAPFQAFFVRITTDGASGSVSFNRSDLAVNQGTQFYKTAPEETNHFSLQLGQGDQYDGYEVEFKKQGEIGEDIYDAYKLFSLDEDAIQLYSTVGDGVKLAKDILPPIKDLDSELHIPLGYTVPVSGEYTFSWDALQDIPESIDVQLIDHKTGQKVDLRSSRKYSFNARVSTQAKQATSTTRQKVQPMISEANTADADESRFELVLSNATTQDKPDGPLPETAVLSPNYPNPFSNSTTMDLKLKEKMQVKITIYNIVGQKVITMADKTMSKGDHPMHWQVPANMPSGIYICKVEAGNKVLTRKMTLVK